MNESALPTLPQPSAPPLRVDEGGVVRVGKSRVSIDLLVEQYKNGMTPEELVAAYDTLSLFEVYAAIAYYLEHPQEVRQYLQQRANEAAELRGQVEAARPGVSRAELLARRDSLEQGHATAGGVTRMFTATSFAGCSGNSLSSTWCACKMCFPKERTTSK